MSSGQYVYVTGWEESGFEIYQTRYGNLSAPQCAVRQRLSDIIA